MSLLKLDTHHTKTKQVINLRKKTKIVIICEKIV